MRRLLAIPLIILAACTPSEPVPMAFAVTEFAPDAAFTPGVSAQMSGETVHVAGALHGSLCASAPEAQARRENGAVTLQVSFGRRTAVPCPAVPRALRYDATLTGLPAGSYELHVVHVTRGLKRNRQQMLVQRLRVD